MNCQFPPLLGQFLTKYAQGSHLVFLFDYDGTLVPIAEHPRLATLGRSALYALERLVQLPRVHAGIVSGRGLADLRQAIPIPGLFLVGTSGSEIDLRGVTVRHPQAEAFELLLPGIVDRLNCVLDEHPGGWLEAKCLGLTMHFRGVAYHRVETLRMDTMSALLPYGHRIRVVECAKSLEITPDLGWTKGTAVQMIVNSLRTQNPFVFYAGDSANDSDAFETVKASGGVTIGIGVEAPATAQFRIVRPAILTEWLSELATALSGDAAPSMGVAAEIAPAYVHRRFLKHKQAALEHT